MPVAAITAGRRMAQNRVSGSKEDSVRDMRDSQQGKVSALPNHLKGSNNNLGESGAGSSKPFLPLAVCQEAHNAKRLPPSRSSTEPLFGSRTLPVRVGNAPQPLISTGVPPTKRLRALTAAGVPCRDNPSDDGGGTPTKCSVGICV